MSPLYSITDKQPYRLDQCNTPTFCFKDLCKAVRWMTIGWITRDDLPLQTRIFPAQTGSGTLFSRYKGLFLWWSSGLSLKLGRSLPRIVKNRGNFHNKHVLVWNLDGAIIHTLASQSLLPRVCGRPRIETPTWYFCLCVLVISDQ